MTDRGSGGLPRRSKPRGGDFSSLRIGEESIGRMNRALVDNINARVGPERHTLVPRRLGLRPRLGLSAERPVVPRPDPMPGRPARLGEPRRPLTIRDLFTATHEQVRIRDGDRDDHPQSLPDDHLGRPASRGVSRPPTSTSTATSTPSTSAIPRPARSGSPTPGRPSMSGSTATPTRSGRSARSSKNSARSSSA